MTAARRWLVTIVLAFAICAQLAFLRSGSGAGASPRDIPGQGIPEHTTSHPIASGMEQVSVKEAPHDDLVNTTSSRWGNSFPFGSNPSHCNVQPNRTQIDPYKGCPLPGLNNLLFTQVNRWFCAFRDGAVYHLRDRTCNKGSDEPYRFSTILQINYTAGAAASSSLQPAICWSDIKRQDEPKNCAWKDIPSFYGSPLWWQARAMIDFHAIYHEIAKALIAKHMRGEPYLASHVRRGDYASHCIVIKRKGIPPWETFRNVPKMFPFEEGCYPSPSLVVRTFEKLRVANPSLRRVFVATNAPSEFENVPGVVTMTQIRKSSVEGKDFPLWFRHLDFMIVELLVLSMGDTFVFNRYSSFSGTAYETARIHGRITTNNAQCW